MKQRRVLTKTSKTVISSATFIWDVLTDKKFLKGKQTCLISIGGADTLSVQYELIRKQFECMAAYLDWNIVFSKSFSASGTGDLAGNAAAVEDMKTTGAAI